MSLINRKNKFYLCIIVLLIVCVVFLEKMSISVCAEEKAFAFNVPNEVGISKQFECFLNASSGMNIKALQIDIVYDPEVVKFKKADFLQPAHTEILDKKGKLAVIVLFEDVMTDGDVFKLCFNSLSKEANSYIKLIIKEAVDENYNDVRVEETFEADFTVNKTNNSSNVNNAVVSRVPSNETSRSIKNESKSLASSIQKTSSAIQRRAVSKTAEKSKENESEYDTESITVESDKHSNKSKYEETTQVQYNGSFMFITGVILLSIVVFVIYREKRIKSVVINEEDDQESDQFIF